jgi:hypothetical protein
VSRGLSQWWPALPAALILYLGGGSFFARFPDFSERRAVRAASSSAPDSMLTLARLAADADAARDSRAAPSRDNPFRPVVERRSAGRGRGKPPAPPPPRRYVLKGTVGNNVATITNAAGQKLILKVGDTVDSAQVISIEANRVVLKDRAGKFELMTEK